MALAWVNFTIILELKSLTNIGISQDLYTKAMKNKLNPDYLLLVLAVLFFGLLVYLIVEIILALG